MKAVLTKAGQEEPISGINLLHPPNHELGLKMLAVVIKLNVPRTGLNLKEDHNSTTKKLVASVFP